MDGYKINLSEHVTAEANDIVNAWNVVEEPSVNAFKGTLDKYWQGLQYCMDPVLNAYNPNKPDIEKPRPDTGF